MIADEIQLRHVIRDKIQSETIFPVQDKIQSEKKSEKNSFLSERKIVRKKIVSDVVSDFQCAK